MIERQELRDAAEKAFPADTLTPPRDASWRLVAEMGWLMIELDEAQGGLGLGRDAAPVLHVELGRVLAAAPLAPALLALQAIAASDSLADRDGWIARICGGDYVPAALLPGAVQAGADGRLHGTAQGFFEADLAGHVLLRTDGRYDLVPLDAEGVTRAARPLWDPSRRMFDVVLDGYAPPPALRVAEGPAAAALDETIAASAQLAIAADCLGGAHAIFDRTLDYLKMRQQFGRPIALFQAIKHRVADLKVKLEAADALFWARVGAPSSLAELGATKAFCAATYRDIAEEAIQLHGGIGLTEEHPCHLFFKRAMLNCQLAGDIHHWQGVAGRALLADTGRAAA